MLTYHNDLARTGQNQSETALTRAAVSSGRFGKLFAQPVDGSVYAQPLYVPGVFIPGKGPHDVVYVATEHDSVYAFDADQASGVDAQPLWHVSFINPGGGITTVPASMVDCDQIVPELGITGTPVIDPSSGTLFVVATTLENGVYTHRLHALDITTGAERAGSPVEIQASVPGTGEGGSTVTFHAAAYKQRPGLLLLNGQVYTTWSSHCDIGKYHGWVMAYDVKTLRQTAVYNNTPNGNQASLWAAGAAPAADSSGNIYLVSGNGSFDAEDGGADVGDSFTRLSTANGLRLADYFTPFNVEQLNDQDLDIGSSGAVLLPDSVGSAAHRHLLVSAGKEARIYLVDRDNMGHFHSGSDSQIPQSITGAIGALFGIPAYFNNTVYFSGSGDHLKAFSIDNAQLSNSPTSMSAEAYTYPGSTPTISSNGTADGIVWAMEGNNGGTLHAYDASNLSRELYSSGNRAADAPGSYVKFSSVTVANGKAYVGTQNSLVVYSLPAGGTANAFRIQNAASFSLGPAAPGEAVALFGNFGAPATVAQPGALPTWLAGVTVHVNGVLAPLYYVGPSQINLQVPFETAAGSASIVVSVGGIDIANGTVTVQASAPGLFEYGAGRAFVVNQDGTFNGPNQGAPVSSIATAFVTGQGAVTPAVATGATAPMKPLAQIDLSRVQVTVGGQAAQPTFVGLTPGFVGLCQVNFRIPQVSPGDHTLVITIDGARSDSETMTTAKP